VKEIVESQRAYYDLRADDYADRTKPSDRKIRGYMGADLSRGLVDELRPAGDVLELAAGTGIYTAELRRHANTLSVVDGSPRMIEINKTRVADPDITYVCADLFAWEPDRTYDTVFFAFWLSHVPPEAFGDFWALVARCLTPHGRVCFVDEDDRAAAHDDVRDVGGVPVATRRLADGRTFDIVKMFWRPDELERRLASMDWDVSVRPTGRTFLVGDGCRR
jgi:demethylmenaquinone methyltransferase/2-methoxy-6-polyprenyl-1,4-benzoquinol methylase